MKKIAIISILSLIGLGINAQKSSNYGFKIGAGISNDLYNLVTFDFIPAYKTSFFYNRGLTDKIITGFELGYIKKGYKNDYALYEEPVHVLIESGTGKIAYNKLFFGPGIFILSSKNKTAKPYIGIQINGEYLVKGKTSGFKSALIIEQEHVNIIDQQDKFSMSGSIDIGFEIASKYILEGNICIGSNKMEENLKLNEVYFGLAIGCYLNKFYN